MLTIDQYHEYRNFMFSDKLYRIAESHCTCGHPIVVNVNKTIMKCSNPSCPEHMCYKADIMLKDMGVQFIGPQIAKKLIIENNLKNHMDILGLSVEQMPSSNSSDVKVKYFNQLQKGRKQPLSKILRYYQLDSIADQTSVKLMDGYSTFKEFFNRNDTLEKIVDHFCRALRQRRTDALIKMAYHLFCSQDELIRCEKYFDTIEISELKLNVCMTGEIVTAWSNSVSFSKRERFIELMNKKYEGILTLNIVSNVSTANVLLLDSTTGKKKINDAYLYGFVHFTDKETDPDKRKIMTFAQFVQFIKEELGEGNDNEYYEIHTR